MATTKQQGTMGESSQQTGLIPRKVFLTSGTGVHKEKLQAFELSLRSAGIQALNLVKVSSILPPRCKMISQPKGVTYLRPGQIVHCVASENFTNEPNRQIAASIGIALPKEEGHYGYISEHHSFGQDSKEAGDYAEDLAATMLATTLGIDFDPDKAYDERKEIYLMSGKIVHTQNITQVAKGSKDGRWTAVMAAAVFII